MTVQSALVIRTTFVSLCFSKKNVLITSGAYKCSYNQRNYLVFWKSVLRVHVLITRVLITRVDCTFNSFYFFMLLDTLGISCSVVGGRRSRSPGELPVSRSRVGTRQQYI